jgi:tRNA threonylcarbamoyl adenosine modification protein (Sua5/YciO/YrdC/YwlC family)
MAVGGIALFPADTVYGLACDAGNRMAVERLYLLKQRPLSKPSAVMFFSVERALDALPELGSGLREALARLLPGGVSLLLPNQGRRFPLACGEDPLTLGLRVPAVPQLAGVSWPVLQSSANRAGEPEARVLADVPEFLRSAADLVIDGGELPGVASTVIDLRRYAETGEWSVVREGAVPAGDVAGALGGQFHFHPATYAACIRADIPVYEEFQRAVAAATGLSVPARVLELGTGTGESALAVLARHRGASLVGIDASASMLAVAAARLPVDRVELRAGRLEDELPGGPFELVFSALCVHHLDGAGKADLFARVFDALAPGGRFVLGDVVVPDAPSDAVTSLTPGYDQPSTVAEQLAWLHAAGFADVRVVWEHRDLAVISALKPRNVTTLRKV